jgi:hypothetical protein
MGASNCPGGAATLPPIIPFLPLIFVGRYPESITFLPLFYYFNHYQRHPLHNGHSIDIRLIPPSGLPSD